MLGAFCSEVALLGEDGVAEWVHLVPAGPEVRAVDGRNWTLHNPRQVIALSMNGVDLPIDYEHQADDPKQRKGNGPVPAAGWIKELAARMDGIWGRVEWTKRARELLAAREYRYISPVFTYDSHNREIQALKGAGLVHTPALRLTALAAEQGAVEGMEDEQDGVDEGYQQDALAELIRKLSDAMGLPPDTDAEGLIRAARDLKNPAKMVPAEAVRDMLAERRTGLALLAEDAAQRKVADALQSAFITPGMKDWALDLCRKDPASFDTFCGAAPPAFGHVAGSQFDRAILREALTPAGSPVLSGQEAEIAAILGLAPEKLR
jgi:phage I-like protein